MIQNQDQITQILPPELQTLYTQATSLYMDEHYAEAVPLLAELIERIGEKELDSKQKAKILFHYAFCLMMSEQYEKAIEQCNLSLELNPHVMTVYVNRGICHSKLKRFAEALVDYNQALELDPLDAKAYYNRGNCYSDLGQFEKALADHNQALTLNPQYTLAYISRGNCYSNLGQFAEALTDFNQALTLNPQLALAHFNRGVCYERMKNFTAAKADYKKALALEPNDQLALKNLRRLWRIELKVLVPDVATKVFEILEKICLQDKNIPLSYYADLSVARALCQGKTRQRLSHTVGMNDPDEGVLLWDWLQITQEPDNPTFIACFTPNQDRLDMWRLYGKDACGTSITYLAQTLSNADLKIPASPQESNQGEDDSNAPTKKAAQFEMSDAASAATLERPFELYHIIYFNQNENEPKFITSGDAEKDLTAEFKELKKLVEQYREEDEAKEAAAKLGSEQIEENLARVLSPLRHMLKSSEYQSEQELRLVVDYLPYGDAYINTYWPENCCQRPSLYLELDLPITAIEEIVVGAKAEHSAYYAEMLKNELKKNGHPKPKARKSTCRYQ